MKLTRLTLLETVLGCLWGGAFLSSTPSLQEHGVDIAPAAHAITIAPSFVANLGQWETDSAFVARGKDSVLRADANGLWLDLASRTEDPDTLVRSLVRLEFEGGESVVPVGSAETGERRHYFRGSDKSTWRSDVPSYAALSWNDRWPGTSLALHQGAGGEIATYELRLVPGADLATVRFSLLGVDALHVDEQGRLIAHLPTGTLTQTAPRAWEELPDGTRRLLNVSFDVVDANAKIFAFKVPGRDLSRPLVIDPALVWSSYLGGGLDEVPTGGCVLDASNQPVICGRTLSLDFPSTPGAYQTIKSGSGDIFISKLRANGSALVFTTYLGGSDDEWGWDVNLTESGEVLIGGHSKSTDFPTTALAASSTLLGTRDAVVTKLSSNGSQLLYSTYLGGDNQDQAHAVAALDDESIVAGGWTNSVSFPTTSMAFDTSFNGIQDAFLTRLDPRLGGILASTFLGGGFDEDVWDIEVASSGQLIVGGRTRSVEFPTTSGAFDEVYDPTFIGGTFVTYVLNSKADLETIEFSTLLHGEYDTAIVDLDVDASGRVAVVGYTASFQLPVTSGGFDSTLGPSADAFVGILSADGSTLEFGSYLGGTGTLDDDAVAIHLADSGVITVVGSGHPIFFPTTPGCYDTVASIDSPDLYVTRFHPNGGSLLYSSFLGNPVGSDIAWGGAVDAQGQVYLLGSCNWIDFPITPGAFDPTYGGAGGPGYGDAVIAKMDLQPTNVSTVGLSTPACKGPLWLTALGPPQAGSSFSVGCSGAPPSAFGVWVASGAPLPLGIPFAGVQLYLDPAQPYVLFPRTADSIGYSQLDTLLPAGAAGLSFLLQSIWLNTSTCAGAADFSASHAVSISVP
jgi:hypothetical protein